MPIQSRPPRNGLGRYRTPKCDPNCKVFYSDIAGQMLGIATNANIALTLFEQASISASPISNTREDCFSDTRCAIMGAIAKFFTGEEDCDEDGSGGSAEPCTAYAMEIKEIWETIECPPDPNPPIFTDPDGNVIM